MVPKLCSEWQEVEWKSKRKLKSNDWTLPRSSKLGQGRSALFDLPPFHESPGAGRVCSKEHYHLSFLFLFLSWLGSSIGPDTQAPSCQNHNLKWVGLGSMPRQFKMQWDVIASVFFAAPLSAICSAWATEAVEPSLSIYFCSDSSPEEALFSTYHQSSLMLLHSPFHSVKELVSKVLVKEV